MSNQLCYHLAILGSNDNILFIFWSSRTIDQPIETCLSVESSIGKHVRVYKQKNRVSVTNNSGLWTG